MGGSLVVAVQQAAIIARDTQKPIRIIAIPPGITDNTAPRPDKVPVDVEKLFGTDANAGDPGLYVTVHDGQVVLTQDGKSLNLGGGETGFAQGDILARLATTPAFMDGDPQMDPTGGGIDPDTSIPKSGCTP